MKQLIVVSWPRLFAGVALRGALVCALAWTTTTATASTNPPPVPTLAQPTESLTLREAATLALARNPSLRAHGYELQAADARKLQAGLRPNPELSIEVEDVLGTGGVRGFDEAQATLQLSQLIELGGKRKARTQVAHAMSAQKRLEAELARVEVLAAVAERFIHVVGDQHEVKLAREATQLAEEVLALANRRVEAGRASPIEEKRARILLARARINEHHAEQQGLISRCQLAALWGATNATFTEAQADLFLRPAMPSFDELAMRIARSPELARWQGEKALREAEIKLADSRRRPDVTAGAGVRQYAGPDDVGFVFQLSLPLPFSDRQQGPRGEARAVRDKADVEMAGTELRLRTALYGIVQELRHTGTELDTLDREILPDAESALALAREGVERAGFSQLELLDAQRTLLELRRERIDAAVAYHQFVVEIEKLLGEPLSSESTPAPKPFQP
jgi:cobalt-zinc-cadmium efflux system outer membrane protein